MVAYKLCLIKPSELPKCIFSSNTKQTVFVDEIQRKMLQF